MQRKLFAVSAVILGCLLFLIGRIAYINASMGNRYAKQVLSQENYDSRTLYSKRGEILDANGRVLAYSERQYHVVLDCAAVNTHEDLDNYQEYIDDSDVEDIIERWEMLYNGDDEDFEEAVNELIVEYIDVEDKDWDFTEDIDNVDESELIPLF